jgi:hypothetical protein
MALSSAIVAGVLGVAGLSLSAGLVIMAPTPDADTRVESAARSSPEPAGTAVHHKTPAEAFLPDPMAVPVHGSWQLLFQPRGI